VDTQSQIRCDFIFFVVSKSESVSRTYHALLGKVLLLFPDCKLGDTEGIKTPESVFVWFNFESLAYLLFALLNALLVIKFEVLQFIFFSTVQVDFQSNLIDAAEFPAFKSYSGASFLEL